MISFGVLCDTYAPPKFKDKFYKVVVRTILLYGQSVGEIKMIWIYEEETRRRTSEELIIAGTSKGKDKSKKYWGKIIRKDYMMQLQVIGA